MHLSPQDLSQLLPHVLMHADARVAAAARGVVWHVLLRTEVLSFSTPECRSALLEQQPSLHPGFADRIPEFVCFTSYIKNSLLHLGI